jgi:DNA-binding XRE family transcriptional regulator
MIGGAVKKSRKENALKARKVAFKTWLIMNDTNQVELAEKLGLSVSAISMQIERGKFTVGVFAEWWQKNITNAPMQNAESNSAAMNGAKGVVA